MSSMYDPTKRAKSEFPWRFDPRYLARGSGFLRPGVLPQDRLMGSPQWYGGDAPLLPEYTASDAVRAYQALPEGPPGPPTAPLVNAFQDFRDQLTPKKIAGAFAPPEMRGVPNIADAARGYGQHWMQDAASYGRGFAGTTGYQEPGAGGPAQGMVSPNLQEANALLTESPLNAIPAAQYLPSGSEVANAFATQSPMGVIPAAEYIPATSVPNALDVAGAAGSVAGAAPHEAGRLTRIGVETAKQMNPIGPTGPLDWSARTFIQPAAERISSAIKESPIVQAFRQGYIGGMPGVMAGSGSSTAAPWEAPATVAGGQVPNPALNQPSGVVGQVPQGVAAPQPQGAPAVPARGASGATPVYAGSGGGAATSQGGGGGGVSIPGAIAPQGALPFGMEPPKPLPRPNWGPINELLARGEPKPSEPMKKSDIILNMLGASAGAMAGANTVGEAWARGGAASVGAREQARRDEAQDAKNYEREMRQHILNQVQAQTAQMTQGIDLDIEDKKAIERFNEQKVDTYMKMWQEQQETIRNNARIGATLQAARISAAAKGANFKGEFAGRKLSDLAMTPAGQEVIKLYLGGGAPGALSIIGGSVTTALRKHLSPLAEQSNQFLTQRQSLLDETLMVMAAYAANTQENDPSGIVARNVLNNQPPRDAGEQALLDDMIEKFIASQASAVTEF